MAFTDLAEHLAEAFGDCQRVDGWQQDLWIRARRERQRLPQERVKDTRAGIAWRSARRRDLQVFHLSLGVRTSRCCRPGCCNLLPPQGNGGKQRIFCRPTCRKALRNRDGRRSPEALRRKYARRNAKRRKCAQAVPSTK